MIKWPDSDQTAVEEMAIALFLADVLRPGLAADQRWVYAASDTRTQYRIKARYVLRLLQNHGTGSSLTLPGEPIPQPRERFDPYAAPVVITNPPESLLDLIERNDIGPARKGRGK